MSGENILEVENLTKHFKLSGKQIVHAVDGVSFAIPKGKTLGLVGESGCGKSTCARTVIRMYDVTDGRILLEGKDITKLKQKEHAFVPGLNLLWMFMGELDCLLQLRKE